MPGNILVNRFYWYAIRTKRLSPNLIDKVADMSDSHRPTDINEQKDDVITEHLNALNWKNKKNHFSLQTGNNL